MKNLLPAPVPVSRAAESTGNLQEQIRLRAYEFYEQRGKADGRDVDDWLQAEADVARTRIRQRAA